MLMVPSSFSRRIYDDGLEALEDPTHPCRHMVEWQFECNPDQPFQLPEPFSGQQSTLRLIFIGLNPSFSPNEHFPRAGVGSTFEAYDRFFRNRFAADNRDQRGRLLVRDLDGHARHVRLWRNIESLGPTLTGITNFQLGTHALLAEVVHFKSTGGWLGDGVQRERLIRHQSERTASLFETIAPCVLVPMGNQAIAQTFTLLGLERAIEPVGALMGRRFETTVKGDAPLQIVPVSHLSWPIQAMHIGAIGRAIQDALHRLSLQC